MRRRFVGGLADPAREEARVALLERGLDLLDAPAVLGERAADRLRRCRGRCRPRCAGSRPRCASCRAASRRRARAARGPRRALRRSGSTTMFASTCGTWLVIATSRSCASASIATGVAPSVGDEAVHERGAGRRRSCATGVRNHVAPSKRPALAFSAPRDSEPQIGWPPTKRGEPAAARDDARLRRADVGDGRVARPPRAPPRPARAAAAIGAATTTSSAPATASSSEPAALERPALDGGRERVRGRRPSRRRRRRARARRGRPTRRSARCRRPRSGQPRRLRRISSARRNARSSDCRAFRRGSQSVS